MKITYHSTQVIAKLGTAMKNERLFMMKFSDEERIVCYKMLKIPFPLKVLKNPNHSSMICPIKPTLILELSSTNPNNLQIIKNFHEKSRN